MPEHFTLVEVAPGVHAAVDAGTGAAISNSAIIDTGDKTIVVDSFMTAQAAQELHDEAVRVTGRGAYLLVNSHWHGDHVRGNQVFADVPIASTSVTTQLIIADSPKDLDAYEAELDGYIQSFEEKLESDDETERALADRRLLTLRQLKAAAPGFKLTLPDLQFEDKLIVEGQRRIELISFGKGHTDSDIFVWIPGEKTVVAADLCWNRIHPRMHDGHPGAWAKTLERILDLGPDHLIPGHGKPGDASIAEALIPYMTTIADYVDAVAGGDAADALPPPSGSEEWQGAERMREGVAIIAGR
jgi:cyclase